MSRLAPCLILLTLVASCDRPTDPQVAPTTESPAFAAAGKSVDPAALTPAPALVGAEAECRADGGWILCHTTVSFELANEPVFDLPCGTIYETSTDARLGTRWYDAADSVIVKRHVREDVEGRWSLSPDGTGPTVTIAVHANWYDAQYADPTDIESGVGSAHGEFTARAPGFGVISHIAGLDDPEGAHHGAFHAPDDPALAARLCAALTG